jgi:hypothetical protein
MVSGFPANAIVLDNQINRALRSIDPKMTNGYIEQWNFGLQDEMRPNLLADVTYSGSAGHHLVDTDGSSMESWRRNRGIPSRRPIGSTWRIRRATSVRTGSRRRSWGAPP